MLEFPSWLQWLGDVIGMEWPQGNEDDMWAMSGDWKSASGQLNEVLGMIDGAKSATLDAYPSGDGRDAMIKSFDELRTGDKSLEALAKAFGDVGEMVYQGGTEIEYTKLMFYSMLTITAVDIAAVWIFPPTAPAEEAAIIAGARFAAGQLLKRAIAKMLEYAGELGAKALMKFLLKHIALNAALAGFQDFAIQEYQVLAGHRHGGINWDQLAMTTFAGGVGGAAGGAFGEAAGRKLGNLFTHEAENFGSKFVQNGAKFAVGAGSGAINAGGAFAASTGWQFVETWSQQGWDKAVAGLEDTKVPWGMIAAGGVMGGAGSLNHSFAESHFENSPKWQNRVPDTPNIGDVGGGFNLRGHGGDQAGAPVVDGSVEHSGAGTGGHGPASSSEPGGFEPVGQTGNQHGSTGPAGSGSEGVHQYSPDQQSGSVEHAVPESGLDTTGHDVGVGAGTSGHDVGLGSGTSGSGHDVGVGSGATGHDAGLGPGEHDSSAAAAAPPPSASTGATAAGSDTPAASSGTSGGASPIDARSPAAGGSEVRGTELRPVDSGRAASDIGRGAADPSRAGAAGTVNRAGAVDASSRGAVESGRGGVEGAGTRPTEASRIQAGAGESQTSGDTGRTGNAKAESVGARAGTESARPGADRSGAGARPGDRAEPGTQRRTGGDSGSDTKSRAGAGEGSGHAEEPRNSEDSARTAEREEPGSDPLVPEENAARPRGDDPESSGAARSDDSEAPSGTRNSEEPSETPHDDVNDESRSRDSGSAGEQRDELADTDFGRDRQGTDSEGARPQEDIERVHTEEVSGGVRGREGTGGGRALEDAGGGREQDNTVGVRRQDDTGTRGQDDTGTRGQDDTGTRGQDDTGTRGQDDTAGGRGRDDTEHAGAQDDTKHAGAQGEPEHTRERDGTEHPRDRGGTEAAREKDTEGAYEHEHARTSPRRAVYPNVDGAVDKPPRDSAGDRSERTGHGPRPEDFPLPPVPAAYSGGDHVRATPAHESGTASSPVGEHPAVEEVSKRGRCAELALRLVKELTGSPVIEDLKRVVGLDGVTAEELQGAAGGRMLRVSGHDEIVRRLMKLRDGACAIVVDSYHAGPDEHGVGAHAYVMVKEGDDIVVRDRSIDPADDPVRLPTDVRESHVILFDHTGRPRHPLSRAERTALSESGRHRLMAVRIGESLDDDIGRMHEVLGGTPTGDRILRRLAAGDYHDYIEHGPHSDGRSGAFGRSTLRATLFGDNMTPVQRALALAHESVHAERFVDGESALDRVRQLPRREFVRSMVHEEALATARRFDLANELRGRGHRIINHPLEVEYQRAYDRARGEYRGPDADVHDYARARAVAALETKFGEVANDHGVTYNDLYGEHWDRAQAKQVESAGARHIPDDPRVRQDLAAAALRRHQADVKVENLAGELDSLARRLSDRIPYDHAMGRERARSLIDEQLRSVDEELGRSDASAGGRPGLRRLAHDLRRMSDLLDEHHNALAESDRARIPETAAAARELLTGMAADHAGARPVGDHFLLIPGEPDRVVFAAGPGEHARLTESAPPEVADALAHSEIEYVEVSADPGGEVRYRGVENPDTDREQPRTAEPGRELVRRFSEAQFEKLRNISSRTDIGDWAMRTLDELGVDYRHDSSADRYEPGRNRLTVDIGGTDAEQMAALVHGAVHAERTATEGQPPARERMGKDQYIRYRLDQEADAHAMEFAALDQLREILPDGDRIPVGKLERAYREAVEGALPEAADFYGRDVSGGAPDEAGRAEFLEAFAHDRGRDAIRPLMDGYRPDAAETLARKYAADWEAAHPNSKADRPDPFWGRYGVPGAVTIHSSTPLEHEYLRQTLHEEAVSAVATGDPRPQYPDVHDVSFTQGSGEYLSHQREEYIRQLDRQIEGLNRMTAAELIHNMDHVTRQGKAQEAARRIFRQEALGIELARARALARRDPGALGGLSPREYASRIVDERMRGLNALHEPDIHAGGQDVIGRTDDGLPSMGDDHVNSSIGTQWKERRAALRAYAEQMIADGAGDHRLNIRWHFDDEDPHPDSGGVPAWGEEPDAAEPALGAELPRRDVVAHLDGERVRLRLVDDGGGRWRVDSMEPVSGEYGRPTLESVRRPGPVRALWERLTGGYEGPNPKYPSGSGMDSDYQTDLTEDIGHLVGNHELEELGDHHLKTNYVRIAKESITLWRNRQRLPGIQHLSGRIDPLPAEHLPAWSEDGREYTPWLDEADPKAVEEVHEELHKAGLDHLVAESAPQDRPDTMVPDHSSAAPGHGPDDPVAGLRAEAARLGVPMTEISPRELRRVQDIVRYHNLRRIAVIEALRDAAHRFDAEQAKVPYRPVSVTDRNPMARYLKEVMLAHGDDPGLLDWNGANNGGESGRDFGPLTLDRSSERPWDDSTDDGRDQGVRIFFENSLRRDQIRDERSTWAELAAVELSRLEPGELDRTLAELSEGVRERLADLADFTARAGEFLDALPSEEIVRVPGDPERLLLLDVRADHDQVLAGAMDADPELAARLNDGDVRIEKWTPVVDADDAVAVRHLGEMRVRTVSADVGGRHLDALLVRDGDGPWRPVQRPPSTEPVAPEARSLAEIGAARDDLARSLGMDPDRLSAEQIDREMRANDMRAIRIEALVDDIGSTDAIDSFHRLAGSRDRLAQTVGEDDTQRLTPERVADAVTDSSTRGVLRRQQIDALTDYYNAVRQENSSSAMRARDRLVRALGAEPERVYPRRPRGGLRTWPDPAGLDSRNLTALVRERIDDPATREAVADFARALGDADPFTDGLRWNPAVDPRVVDGEVPLRDPNVMAHLGRIVGDDNRLLAADPGDPDTVPAEPDRDWARLLGLDLTDATPRQFIRAYEAYRDGRIDKFERLSADQLAKVHATMRGEVGRRAADLRALAELRDRYERTLDDLPENRHRNIERLQREWGDAVRRRELAAAELDRYAAEFGLRGDELRSDTLKHGTALEDLIRRIPDPNADTEIRPGLDREIFRFHERREGLSRTVRDYHLIEARADELRARLEAARERDAMLTEQEREDAAARTEHPGHTEPGTAAEPEAAEPGGAEPGGVAESHTARREASAQPHAAESETAVEPDSRAGDHTAAHHDPRGPETGDSSDSRRSPVPSASDGDAGGEPPGSGVPPDVPPHDWSNRGGAADDWHRTGPDDLHRPTGRELRKALRQLSDATARRDRAWNAMVGRARELGVDPARIRRDLLREAIIREIHSGEATFDRRRDLHGLLNEFDQGTVDLIVNARARRLGVALPTDHQVADALRDRLAQPGQRGHELATELAERRTVSRYRLERIAEELGIDPAGRTRRQLQDELRAAARDYPDRIGVDRRRSAVELVDRFRVAAATRSMRHDAAQQQAEHEVMRQRAGDQRKGPRIPGVSYRRFRLGTADRALVEGAAGERGRWVGVGSGDAPESRMPEQERRIHLGEGYDSVYYRVRLDADGHVWVGEYEPPHTTPIEPEPAQAAPRRPGDWEPIGAEREYRPGRNAPRWKARNLQQEVAELSKMADDNLASLNEAFQQIESLPKERTAYHVEPEPHGRLGRGRMTSRELEQAVRRLIADRRAQADEFWNRDGIDQRDLGAFLAEREAVEAWAGDTEEAGSALLGLLRVYEDAYLSQVDRAKMNLAVLAAHDIRSEFAGDGIGPDGLPATGPDEVAHRIPGDGQVPDRLVVVAPTANPDHVLAPAVRDELTGTDGEFIFQRVRVDDTGTVWIADMREPDLQLGSGGHPVELEATPAETAPEYPADPDARVGGEHDVTVADPGEFAQHQLDRLLAERERVVVQRHLWFEKARDYRRRWFSDISIDVLDSEGASDRAGRLAETLRQLQNETGFSVEREFGMDAPALTTHEQYGERELEQRHHQVRTLARALEHYLHHGTELGDIDRAIRRLEDQGAVYDPMRVVRFDDEARRLEAGYRDAVREAKPLRATLHELTDRLTGDREHPPSADDLRRLAAATEVVERADHEIDLFNDRRVARRSAGGWNDAVAEHWRAEVGARPQDRVQLHRLDENVWVDTGDESRGRPPRIILVAGRADFDHPDVPVDPDDPGGPRRPTDDRFDTVLRKTLSRRHDVARLLRNPDAVVDRLVVTGERPRTDVETGTVIEPRTRVEVLAPLEIERRELPGHGRSKRSVPVADPVRWRDMVHEVTGIDAGEGISRRDPARDRQAAEYDRRDPRYVPGETLVRWRGSGLEESDRIWHDIREGEAAGFRAHKPQLPGGFALKKYWAKRVDGWLAPTKGWAPFGGWDESHRPIRSYEEKMPDGFSGNLGAEPFQNMVEPLLLRIFDGHWPEMSYEEILSLSEAGRAMLWAHQGPGPGVEPPPGWDEDAHHDLPLHDALYTIGKRWVQLYGYGKTHPWLMHAMHTYLPETTAWMRAHTTWMPDGPFDPEHPVLRKIPIIRSFRGWKGWRPGPRTDLQPPHRAWYPDEHWGFIDRDAMVTPAQRRDIELWAAVQRRADQVIGEYASDTADSDVDRIVDRLTSRRYPLADVDTPGNTDAERLRMAHRPDGSLVSKSELRERILQVKNHVMRDVMLVRDVNSADGDYVWKTYDRLPHLADAWKRLTGDGDDSGLTIPEDEDFVGLDDFYAESEILSDTKAYYLRAQAGELDPTDREHLLTWYEADLQAAAKGHDWDTNRARLSGYLVIRDGVPMHPSELPPDRPEGPGDKRIPISRLRYAVAPPPPDPSWLSPRARDAAELLAETGVRQWFPNLPDNPVEALKLLALHDGDGRRALAATGIPDPLADLLRRAGRVELLADAENPETRRLWAGELGEPDNAVEPAHFDETMRRVRQAMRWTGSIESGHARPEAVAPRPEPESPPEGESRGDDGEGEAGTAPPRQGPPSKPGAPGAAAEPPEHENTEGAGVPESPEQENAEGAVADPPEHEIGQGAGPAAELSDRQNGSPEEAADRDGSGARSELREGLPAGDGDSGSGDVDAGSGRHGGPPPESGEPGRDEDAGERRPFRKPYISPIPRVVHQPRFTWPNTPQPPFPIPPTPPVQPPPHPPVHHHPPGHPHPPGQPHQPVQPQPRLPRPPNPPRTPISPHSQPPETGRGHHDHCYDGHDHHGHDHHGHDHHGHDHHGHDHHGHGGHDHDGHQHSHGGPGHHAGQPNHPGEHQHPSPGEPGAPQVPGCPGDDAGPFGAPIFPGAPGVPDFPVPPEGQFPPPLGRPPLPPSPDEQFPPPPGPVPLPPPSDGQVPPPPGPPSAGAPAFPPGGQPNMPPPPWISQNSGNGSGDPSNGMPPIGMPPVAPPMLPGTTPRKPKPPRPEVGYTPPELPTPALIPLQEFGGYRCAGLDPVTGSMVGVAESRTPPGGIFGELDGWDVLLFRMDGRLHLRIGTQIVDVDDLAVIVSWQRTGRRKSEFAVVRAGRPVCTVRYRYRAPDRDVGLWIRDVLDNPSMRAALFIGPAGVP